MRRLVLIGGGHAHLEVLRQAAARPFAGGELVLVSPSPGHHYSSMVPGYLRGCYAEPELAFDLAALCRAAGARFVEGLATRADPGGRWVDVGGERIECDLLSADVGCAAAGIDEVPGAREHALTVRPMSRAVVLRQRLDALADTHDGTPQACVVGGGAGGVEVALAMHARLGPAGGVVTLVERDGLLAGYSPHVRQQVERLLARRGVRLMVGDAAARVTEREVELTSGATVPSTLTVWLTGAAPTAFTAASELERDERGFWLVDSSLRAVGGGMVWGAGDGVSLAGHPALPKAGVYAVRQGPVLAANLRAVVADGPTAAMRRYVPQARFLSILDSADGRALVCWRSLSTRARWGWWLKRAIDQRFMARYQRVSGVMESLDTVAGQASRSAIVRR